MNESVSRRAAVRSVILGMGLTVALTVPAAVWASHFFNDVPSGHPFHDAISAVADAGITTGFPDGGYHPSDPVTRQAMAAFLERGLGRVATNDTTAAEPIAIALMDTTMLTAVFVDAGAAGADGAGLVHISGRAALSTSSPSSCPCYVELEIVNLDTSAVLSEVRVDVLNVPNAFGSAIGVGTVEAVVPLAGDATGRYGLQATNAGFADSLTGSAQMSALYVPFGPDGDDTVTYCSTQEDEPNGSTAQAEPLTVAPMFACLEPSGDVDFFSVTVSNGARLTATTFGLGGVGTCDTDTTVTIRKPDGIAAAMNTDGGPGLCSRAATGTLSAGTHYVEVTGSSSLVTGSYQLIITIN